MNWDLTSYFPRFDGSEMRRFKEVLRCDIASLKDRAASLLPLNDENASGWEDVLIRNEALTRRMSHLSSYVSCLAASDGRNEDYLKEEATLAAMRAELAKVRGELLRGVEETPAESVTSCITHRS